MTNKFSVIIPTLWIPKTFKQLLNDLNNCELISEIIIIDNNPNDKIDLSKFNKIKYYSEGKNIYVNPAWNKGVELSKNNLIAICNDDIIFSVNETFEFISKNVDKLGVIGVHTQCINNKKSNIELFETDKRLWGSGTLMFVKKEKWVNIPKELKIWFGDDFIFHKNKPAYTINIPNFQTKMSESHNAFDYIKTIIENDKKTWIKINNKI